MSSTSVYIYKEKRPANTPLMGNGKVLKESNINSSPILNGYQNACSSNNFPTTLPRQPASYLAISSAGTIPTTSSTSVTGAKIAMT
jgi:hypothetical protein